MAFITWKVKRFVKKKQGEQKFFRKDFNNWIFKREKITKILKLPATNATNLDTTNQNVWNLRNNSIKTRRKSWLQHREKITMKATQKLKFAKMRLLTYA